MGKNIWINENTIIIRLTRATHKDKIREREGLCIYFKCRLS